MSEITQDRIQLFEQKFSSVQHLRSWCMEFLDIDLPSTHVDPESNSSPAEWMYEAYNTYRNNHGDEGRKQGFIVLSSRDSYKTLTESILSVILMCHFNATIAHMAAIEPQAYKAIQYITTFLTKVKPILQAQGRGIDSQSKRRIQIKDDKSGRVGYVNVIVATIQGANSEHTTVMSIDEIDVMRFPQAYEEAKYIPAYDAETGQFPITIKTSTRKFAFGLMEKELQLAPTTGDKILRWNIIDITERCPEKRHQPQLPKELRYIHPRLPLKNLSKDEWSSLTEAKRGEYESINAYAGCAKCLLLPVCRMRLANRSPDDKGGLFKPIQFTIDQFKTTSPDSAEAQLMCWKPSQAGLIYGRFSESEAPEGNVMTIQQAYERYTGQPGHVDMTIKDLVTIFRAKGVPIYAGVDWGFRHYFAITVSALVGKQWWFLDCHAVAGLEFDQMMALAIEVRDMYKPMKWFVDDSQPMFIKEFKKKKMPCPKFKKDVTGGIEATRKQIMDASGNRHLFVVKHERTDFLIKGFQNHHFKLDAAGLPTLEPDDEEYADVMDSVRYQAQNLHGGKANKVISPNWSDAFEEAKAKAPKNEYQDVLTQKIRNLAIEQASDRAGSSKSKTTFWDFGGNDE
jgi:hypothetical protein